MNSVAPEVLLYSLLLGAGLGLLFTALEMLRILLALGRIITFLTDVFFCTVSAGVSFILALSVSGGSMRFYQLGSEILGFACVYLTLTYAVRRFLPRLIRLFERIGEKVRRRTDTVVKKILRKKTERKLVRRKKRGFFNLRSKKNEKKT